MKPPLRHQTQEDQACKRPVKRVQFRNIMTDPESSDLGSDSHGISREDTMVEHSVVVNEEDDTQSAVSGYMKALESVKFDQIVVNGKQI